MKFYTKYIEKVKPSDPQHGDLKLVSKFLIWPRTIVNYDTGDKETRWLERATLVYKFYGGSE
jgi:hypothetical protein